MQSRQLAIDEVHVCCVSPRDFFPQAQMFFQQLTIDEKKRADRYYFVRDKRRYIIVRGILRWIISYYLDVDPGKIEFSYGQYGKPALAGIFSETRLCFNVSHSGQLALLAFALDREVGVDIEYIRDIPEMEQIVERFFSYREKELYRSLPRRTKKEKFFQMWTRKEAFLKAVGEGLYVSLDAFSVFPVSDKPVSLLDEEIKLNSDKTLGWYVKDLQPHPGFTAAYAVEGEASHRWIHWTS